MPPFLKTLITQNLKLKSQNKTVGYDLHHFIYARVKNYDISILFWLSSRACKNVLMWIISRHWFFNSLIHIKTKLKYDNFLWTYRENNIDHI